MKTIDARTLACPRPVILAKKAIREENLEELMVRVDNKIATENLTKMAGQLGFRAEVTANSKTDYEVYLKKTAETARAPVAKESGEYIVVISSDHMGTGDETFSKTLLEGFVYALTEQDVAPKYVVFYNMGVTLPSLNDKVIGDLKTLEERGSQVLSCGLCLGQYELKEKLKVGEITNMYRIAELMIQYKVVKPC